MTPQKKQICQVKMYLPKSKTTSQKYKSNKKYFTINFIHLIRKACTILSTVTNQCQRLHLQSLCLHLPHTHSQHSTAIPQHNIISPIYCIGYTALLKTLHSHFW